MAGLPLLLLLALPAGAAGVFADCMTDPATKRPREDYAALRECQRIALERYAKKDKKGKKPSAASVERFEDHQRGEAKRFFENPNADALGGGGSTLVDSPDVPSGDTPASRGKKGQLGGLSTGDRARAGESTDALAGLEGRLKAAAGDGSKGITPGMARDIIATLTSQQGGVSGDMKSLLDSVVRDGGKLKPETMQRLQDAARSAKESGLQLGIDPKLEAGLLESDFSKDKVPDAPSSPNAL